MPQESALGSADFHGDFLDLLASRGHSVSFGSTVDGSKLTPTESTTVLAIRYADGVLIAGDRRATAGTSILYDRADKVLEIDEHTAMAISGSPAIAYEMARVLEYSLRYYRRSQLQELSLEGKLRTLSRLIRDNLGMALQGIGAVIPILGAFDVARDEGKIYFYDALGAQFEVADFATTGSGSVWVRGALYYLNRWERQLAQLNLHDATAVVLRMLDAAAEYDAATGGYNRRAGIFPVVKRVTRGGTETLDPSTLSAIYTEAVEVTDV